MPTYEPALEADVSLGEIFASYGVAAEQDQAPTVRAIYSPAYENDYAISPYAVYVTPATETERALPLYRRGGPLADLVVICGAGKRFVTGAVQSDGSYERVIKEFIPMYHGIAVRPGLVYGFSIYIKLLHLSIARAGIMWFEGSGKVTDQMGTIESPPETPPNTNWKLHTVQGAPPESPRPGTFLVPYVRITDTYKDIPFYMAGAQVYTLGEAGSVTVFAPDQYLTLGDPEEKIGIFDEEEGGGYLIGRPGG